MLDKSIFVSIKDGKITVGTGGMPKSAKRWAIIHAARLESEGDVTFNLENFVIVPSNFTINKKKRKNFMLRIVKFGCDWYVYDRKSGTFLQKDGSFHRSDAYYVKTREEGRKLIKRYFE